MLTTVPSGLWRIAMVVGIPVGASDQIRYDRNGFPGWGTLYVFGLTFVLVGLASLTLDLVQQWGETVPRWIPLLGGRPVPPLAAVIPAVTGAIALTVLWAGTMANIEPIWAYYALEGRERVLMMVCYAPLLLWDPLLTAVTISYHGRCAAFPTTRDGFGGTDWADLPSDQPGMADDAAQQQAGTRRRWLSESAGLHPPLVGG